MAFVPAIANAGGKGGADDGEAVAGLLEGPGAAEGMVAAIRKTTDLPIKFVLNTHFHLDHVARGAGWPSRITYIVSVRAGSWLVK